MEAALAVVAMIVAPGTTVVLAAISASVVVEVVLTIMPRMLDPTTGVVLRGLDALAFASRNVSIGAGPVFHALDARLVALQSCRFARRQRATARALLDAPLLGGLALVDGCGAALATVVLGQGRQGNDGGEGEGEQIAGFHLAIS